MPAKFISRTISYLIATLFVFTAGSAPLHGQESAFDPSGLASSINSVNADLPAALTQQDNVIEIGAESEIFNTVATTEAVEFPDTASYSVPTLSPEIGGAPDVGVAYTEIQPRPNGRFGRIRSHFREASSNAPDDGITVSLLGGWAYANWNIDEFGRTVGESFRVGDTLGFAIGKRFNPRIRSDVELSWRKSESWGYLPTDIALGYPQLVRQYETELKHFSGMLNIYYDFDRPRGSFLTPYTGLGLGVTQQDFRFNADGQPRYENSDTRFAFQGMIGVSAQVMVHNEFFVEQRAFSTFENSFSRTIYEVLIGLRHTF